MISVSNRQLSRVLGLGNPYLTLFKKGGDEFLGCVYSEFLSVPAVGFLRFIYDNRGFVVVDDIRN